MPFGIIGRTGLEMRQGVGFGTGPREGVLLGANLGRAIVTNGNWKLYGVGVRQCLDRRSCGLQRRGPLPRLLWADLFDLVVIQY